MTGVQLLQISASSSESPRERVRRGCVEWPLARKQGSEAEESAFHIDRRWLLNGGNPIIGRRNAALGPGPDYSRISKCNLFIFNIVHQVRVPAIWHAEVARGNAGVQQLDAMGLDFLACTGSSANGLGDQNCSSHSTSVS